MIKVIPLVAALLIITSCAAPVVQRGAWIPLPKQPDRIEFEEPGQNKEKGVTYLSRPTELKPNQYWRAPADGGYVWRNKDLKGIEYGLREWQRWGLTAKDLVEGHNKKFSTPPAKKPWYKLW